MTAAQKYRAYRGRWISVDMGWVPGHAWQTGLSHAQRSYAPGWRGELTRRWL